MRKVYWKVSNNTTAVAFQTVAVIDVPGSRMIGRTLRRAFRSRDGWSVRRVSVTSLTVTRDMRTSTPRPGILTRIFGR